MFNKASKQNFTPFKHEIPEIKSLVTLLTTNYKSVEGIELLESNIFKNFNTIKSEDFKLNSILDNLSKDRKLDIFMNFLIIFSGA